MLCHVSSSASRKALANSQVHLLEYGTVCAVGSPQISDQRGSRTPPSPPQNDPRITDHLPHKSPPPLPSKMIHDFCGVVHWDLMEKGTLLHPNL